ncbi:MAG: acetylxylan esterase [Planctomyces sp.]|nr:acetylxylan esterase [Planctomyces sp.]
MKRFAICLPAVSLSCFGICLAWQEPLVAVEPRFGALEEKVPDSQGLPVEHGQKWTGRDTLSCKADASSDAQECISGLEWKPTDFDVSAEPAADGKGDVLIRFPSPRPAGHPVNDLVAMEWYAARDFDRNIVKAPAVVVVHESGRGMTVGRLIAKGLAENGLHAFMIQLPGYGARRVEGSREIEQMLPALRQAVADVRRARDAVAALPHVDTDSISVQGTSLGGFVTATVAGLDEGYSRVFVLLAGGNLHEVVLRGAKDAAGVREKLAAAGITGDQIIQLARPIEPMRLAHRVRPECTWLYSGQFDDVVPPDCSFAWSKAAQLPETHHIELPADHYSGIVYLPMVIIQMKQHIEQ